MTTPRENLLSVFRHERPEWIPVAGHCDPYSQPSREGMPPDLAAALSEVRWTDEATVTLSRYLGLDIMDWYRAPVRITRRNVTVERETDGDFTMYLLDTVGVAVVQGEAYGLSPYFRASFVAPEEDLHQGGQLIQQACAALQ